MIAKELYEIYRKVMLVTTVISVKIYNYETKFC
jgi:hypothetical protein